MASVTIKLVSPHGAPMDLTLPSKKGETGVMALLERAEEAAQAVAARDGWALADAAPNGPSVAEMESMPTFCGFPCSDTSNSDGYPTFIIAHGAQAMRREKQGDVWYSIKNADGSYDQVLRIPKGELVNHEQQSKLVAN